MNKIRKVCFIMALILISSSLVSCKKDKGNVKEEAPENSTEVASNEDNDSILRPTGTIKPHASTISLFIKTYNENKDKEMSGNSNTANDGATSNNENNENKNEGTEAGNQPTEGANTEENTVKPSNNANQSENNNNTNANPGSTVPETTDQSSIDLPYGGNPQAVKEKAAADAKEEEGKFELRSQEKLKEGKDEEKK